MNFIELYGPRLWRGGPILRGVFPLFVCLFGWFSS